MQGSTSNTGGAPNELPRGSRNTINDYDEEETSSTSSQENDGHVMPMLGSPSATLQVLNESDIQSKSDHLYEVCKDKTWDTFEQFLSDETISKADKKIIFQKCYSLGCRMPIVKGAPITLVQNIIDCLEEVFFGESGYSMLEAALLNSSDELAKRFPAYKYTTVSYDVVELLVSIGGADLVKMRCLYERGRRSLFQTYLGWNGQCPRIINLLLQVCRLDLLELQDKDGVGILEFTNRTQRDIIIDYLQGLDQSPRVQKYIESLTNAGVTPKVFFSMVDNY
ncbi:predicted protein [Chaetoceros tenuissimus]|uniref:Uncharacterized protein n=1 Tax=Chaetoceros tenuissimus TaxID=426638 RepID=A0AAD3CIM6_9STRA|nr:predicted protein [Chaetoceros tenuissimus]